MIGTSNVRHDGGHWWVWLTETEAILTPIRMSKFQARKLAVMATDLSKEVDGILPMTYDEETGKLRMPRAPGKNVKSLRTAKVLTDEENAWIDAECERIATALRSLGYEHGDIEPKNVMFDRETRRVTLIDYGNLQLIKGQDEY